MNRNTGKRPMRERVIAFMMGRNGPDALYNFVMYTCIALILINIFLRSFILSVLYFAAFAYAVFRMMSKNVYKRQKENAAYLRLKKKLTSPFELLYLKFRDRKTHVYRKCPSCKSTLRFPKRTGEHTAVCPHCGNRFNVTVK